MVADGSWNPQAAVQRAAGLVAELDHEPTPLGAAWQPLWEELTQKPLSICKGLKRMRGKKKYIYIYKGKTATIIFG